MHEPEKQDLAEMLAAGRTLTAEPLRRFPSSLWTFQTLSIGRTAVFR